MKAIRFMAVMVFVCVYSLNLAHAAENADGKDKGIATAEKMGKTIKFDNTSGGVKVFYGVLEGMKLDGTLVGDTKDKDAIVTKLQGAEKIDITVSSKEICLVADGIGLKYPLMNKVDALLKGLRESERKDIRTVLPQLENILLLKPSDI